MGQRWDLYFRNTSDEVEALRAEVERLRAEERGHRICERNMDAEEARLRAALDQTLEELDAKRSEVERLREKLADDGR